jgi:hypothetical protein
MKTHAVRKAARLARGACVPSKTMVSFAYARGREGGGIVNQRSTAPRLPSRCILLCKCLGACEAGTHLDDLVVVGLEKGDDVAGELARGAASI